MVERSQAPSLREQLVDRLDGPPGRYAVVWVMLTLLWIPGRLLLDRGDDPIAESIAAAGMHGAGWALIPMALEGAQRQWRRRGAGYVESPAPGPVTEERARARGGALVGLAVGVPFGSALLVLCLITARDWGYSVFFGLVLLAIVGLALRNLRRSRSLPTG